MDVRVQSDPFDMGAELNRFANRQDNAGAVVSFSGIVRDLAAGDLQHMQIEHYPGMTERAMTKITHEAMTRWSLVDAFVLHRYGDLTPGEPIMMVATAARHRADAFAAAEFLMDYLKSRAPFWKKETTTRGDRWIEAKAGDLKKSQDWS